MKTLLLLPIVWLCGCSSTNNLFLGEVRAKVGSHPVTVTDCYRLQVESPRTTGSGAYEFTPCRDARISIVNEELTVNGQGYGRLKPGERVLVDHGVVSTKQAG
jgi:hypothetical protein